MDIAPAIDRTTSDQPTKDHDLRNQSSNIQKYLWAKKPSLKYIDNN